MGFRILTVGEMPSHKHNITITTENINGQINFFSNSYNDESVFGSASGVFSRIGISGGGVGIGTSETTWRGSKAVTLNKNNTHSGVIDNAGSNISHNNMMPYLAVYIWKRTA